MDPQIQALAESIRKKPRYDRLIVLPLVPATSSQVGVIITDENREKPELGVVIAVGTGGVAPETGREVPIYSQVGELVVYGRYAGLKHEIPGPDGALGVFIMRDIEVLAAQPADTFELEIHEGNLRKMHEKGLTCEFCPHYVSPVIEEERARLVAQRDGTLHSEGDAVGSIHLDGALEFIEAERERLRLQEREQDAAQADAARAGQPVSAPD